MEKVTRERWSSSEYALRAWVNAGLPIYREQMLWALAEIDKLRALVAPAEPPRGKEE